MITATNCRLIILNGEWVGWVEDTFNFTQGATMTTPFPPDPWQPGDPEPEPDDD